MRKIALFYPEMENSEALLLELEGKTYSLKFKQNLNLKIEYIRTLLIVYFFFELEFNSNNDEHKQINSNLENFIEQVAKTGTYM